MIDNIWKIIMIFMILKSKIKNSSKKSNNTHININVYIHSQEKFIKAKKCQINKILILHNNYQEKHITFINKTLIMTVTEIQGILLSILGSLRVKINLQLEKIIDFSCPRTSRKNSLLLKHPNLPSVRGFQEY